MESELSLRDFIMAFRTLTETALKAGFGAGKLVAHVVNKANENKKQALVAEVPGYKASPVIYPEDLYKEYQNGVPIETLAEREAEHITAFYNGLQEKPIQSAEDMANAEHLSFHVINTERNADLLETCAHVNLPGGLSAVPYCRVSDNAAFLVTHDSQNSQFRLTDSELLQAARKGTQSEEYQVLGMSAVLRESLDEEMIHETMPSGEEGIYILTNRSRINGASALMSTHALEEAGNRIGEDYYIIPSSVHELIAVPVSTVADPSDLQRMCRDVNESVVSPADYLGENILHYNRQSQKLSQCNSLQELKAIQEKKLTIKPEHQSQHVHLGRRS